MKKVGYVDGFVLAIPKKNKAKYRKMAQEAGEIWMKHGALGFKECVGFDLEPDMGGFPVLTFEKLMKPTKDEDVWFSYIEYESKKHRDQVNRKVMKEMEQLHKDDPDHMKNMPFEMNRMAVGGFKVAVSL